MIPDLGIYRSAKRPVDQHGDEAPIDAAMWADAILDKGDMRPRSAAADYRCERSAVVHVQGAGRGRGRK